MKRSLLIVLCLMFGVIYAATLWDENVKVRSSLAVEWTSAGAETSDGGMLYVWTDTHANDRDLYVQRVSSQGNPVWTSPRVIDNKSGIQKSPLIAKTSDNNFVVAWIDCHSTRNGDIYLQKIDQNGQRLWQEGGIAVTDDPTWETSVMMTTDELGGVILAWTHNDDSTLYQCAQSYGSTGNRRWQEGGIHITGMDYYLATTIVPDGNNGFFLAYSSDYDSLSRVYLNRYNMNGVSEWAAPVCIGDEVSMNRVNSIAKGSDAVYLLWTYYDGYDSTFYMQKYSLDGIAQWGLPLEIDLSGESYDIPQELIYSAADNSVLLSLIACTDPAQLILRKISSSGELLWSNSEPVDTSPEYLYGFSCYSVPDNQGGCYIAWTHFVDDYFDPDLYIKHYDINGINVWQSNGVPLSVLPGRQYEAHLNASAGRIWAAWNDQGENAAGICFQKLTAAGVPQLEPNGRTLVSGLNSMFTEGRFTVSRSNDMLMIWDDDRFRSYVSQVYMQGINPDGSFDYALNGIPITDYTGANQYVFGAKVLPNDQVVVVWLDGRLGPYQLFAQLLGADGSRLWGAGGLQLSNFDSGWSGNPQISVDNGNIYIGWTHYTSYDTGSIGSVWMQKITGGQIQWGDYGLSMITDTDLCDNRLTSLDGRYIVYSKRYVASTNMTDCYALRFNESDGTPAAGWGSNGLPVSQGSPLTVHNRYVKAMHAIPGGVFILYVEYTNELGDCVLGQYFDADGHYLQSPAGTLILNPANNFLTLQNNCGSNDFALLWQDADEFSSYLRMQRFDYDIVPLWDSLLIATNSADAYYANLIRFENNAFSVVWHTPIYSPDILESDLINYLYVTPDGELVAAEPETIETGHSSIYSLQGTAVANRALLTWWDGSSYWEYKDEPIEHVNLWAQMISNETVAAIDPEEVPGFAATLYPNFPNPFNPSTTITYQLKSAEKVVLSIYNMKGQLVRTLLSAEEAEGAHSVLWNGCDDHGRGVASGVYLYRLSVGSVSQTRKMLLLK